MLIEHDDLIIDKGENYISVFLKGDMGENARLKMTQQEDGDVVLSIYTVPDKNGIQNSIEFCTFSGGGRYPIVAQKLREIINSLQLIVKNGGK